jgi:hypothetical protein
MKQNYLTVQENFCVKIIHHKKWQVDLQTSNKQPKTTILRRMKANLKNRQKIINNEFKIKIELFLFSFFVKNKDDCLQLYSTISIIQSSFYITVYFTITLVSIDFKQSVLKFAFFQTLITSKTYF